MNALAPIPPHYKNWREMAAPIKRGDTGWPTYAVQRVIAYDSSLAADGIFGLVTHKMLRAWQAAHELEDDGIAGPATQQKMCSESCKWVQHRLPELPPNVMEGLSKAESGQLLAATNWYTPPGGTKGVDCGVVQWRVYGPPFRMDRLYESFDARRSLHKAGSQLLARAAGYRKRRPTLSPQLSFKLAVLAHNAPFLSEQYVYHGRLLNPNAPAVWTTKPTGGHYTQGEWVDVYLDRILSGK